MSNYAEQIARLAAGESFEISREDFRNSINDPMDRFAYLPLARRLAAQAGCKLEVDEQKIVFRKKPPKN
ncbi:MAG: hypothetical protein ACOY42_02755 [Pseudomonadota bacterium]|jgi:hypothetical protein